MKKIFGLFLLISFYFSTVLFAVQDYQPIYSGSRKVHKVALTFDDGPNQSIEASKLLDVLDKYGVRATFFVIGKEVNEYQDLVYRMFTTGHEIANHTYSHNTLINMSSSEINFELSSTNKLLKKITGKSPKLFRPPGGKYNANLFSALQQNQLQMIMWDVNAGDYISASPFFSIKGEYRKTGNLEYNKNAEKIYEDVIKIVRNGSIILFHNGTMETIKAVPLIIEDLQKKGYQFVTISELLGE